MKIDRRLDAVSVKCPTCNCDEVASYEMYSDNDGRRLVKVAIRMQCLNEHCPRRRFSVVFNVYAARTTMDYEFPA